MSTNGRKSSERVPWDPFLHLIYNVGIGDAMKLVEDTLTDMARAEVQEFALAVMIRLQGNKLPTDFREDARTYIEDDPHMSAASKKFWLSQIPNANANAPSRSVTGDGSAQGETTHEPQ